MNVDQRVFLSKVILKAKENHDYSKKLFTKCIIQFNDYSNLLPKEQNDIQGGNTNVKEKYLYNKGI